VNSPEQVFKLQSRLSEFSGTKKISEWLIGIAFLLLLAAGGEAIIAKESILRAVSWPLLLIALFTYLRSEAKRRVADLSRQLSS
jgi:hypothetical protein